jgi:hypothetical protein
MSYWVEYPPDLERDAAFNGTGDPYNGKPGLCSPPPRQLVGRPSHAATVIQTTKS